MTASILNNLALNVTDLSTKGTNGSRLLLTFKDAGGTPVRLEGGARLGPAPALDLVLSAPSFSLKNYRKFVHKWPAVDLSKGIGAFTLGLNLHDGKVAAQGKLGVDHVAVNLGKGVIPLKAELEFTGGYDTKADEATLDACSLRLDEIVRMHAAGTVRQVRKAREFAAAVSFAETDVRELLAILPPELRGNVTAAGTLSSSGFRFSGNATNGITAGNGKISLSRVELAKGGRHLVKDLAADISLVRGRTGWEALGRVSQGKGPADLLVQDLEGRFSAALSSRMKPLQAGIPSFTARISGIPLRGRIAYRPGSIDPFAASLAVDKAPVAALNRYLGGGKVTFSAGTVALAFQASGRGVRDFRGTLQGDLKDIIGSAAGKNLAIKEGGITADFSAVGGKPVAAGNFRCGGAFIDGKAVEATSAFGVRNGELLLSGGSVTFDRTRLQFASIRGPLPKRIQERETTRVPLRLHLAGIAGQSGEASIGGLAGELEVDFVSGRGKRWLSGSGALSVTSLAFKGREAGSLDGRLKFTESGVAAQIEGRLLGGRLSGSAGFDPFDPKKKVVLSLNLDGAQCAALASYGPARQTMKIKGGVLDAKLAGGYSADTGLQCRLEADGTGLILAGNAGKPLLADGTLHTVCDVTRDHLFIREGAVGAGSGTVLKVRGEVTRYLSPDREGEVSISLPTTPLDSLRVTVRSALPPGFRERICRRDHRGERYASALAQKRHA